MPEPRRQLLSRCVWYVLRTGRRHPKGICSLPWDLFGSARSSVLTCLSHNDIVRVRHWDASRAGDPIGPITDQGREVLERGWL